MEIFNHSTQKQTLAYLCVQPDEISLIQTTPVESAAAKARLDEVRKKRRERHAKKKSEP